MLRITAALMASASAFAVAGLAIAQTAPSLPQANDAYFTQSAAALDAMLSRPAPIEGHARNIILFIGDGWSIPTNTASRILEGQTLGVDGESFQNTVDGLPYLALVKTYSNDGQTPDSAPTATAMVTGIKTNNGVIGVNSSVTYGDCAAQHGNEVTSIFELAEEAGLATGIISTARITHATPAAAYAHTADRNWEATAPEGCNDIASQLIAWPAGDGFEVVLGGGRAFFTPNTAEDVEDTGRMGNRTDGRDLTAEWTAIDNNHAYVTNLADFEALDLDSGVKILGLFERDHMEYEADRGNDAAGEPSIAEMTAAAITRLSQNENGFVLMVEGGRIDHAHHAGNAARALTDAIAFQEAIAAALEMTDPNETLIVVTADHSHTMTIGGYIDRGNPVLGLVYEGGELALGADGLPYTAIQYGNGPGGVFAAAVEGAPLEATTRPDLTDVDTTDINFLQPALVPLSSETHAADDVAAYAVGPWAHLISGTIEQNYIYQVLSYASGLGR